MHERRKLSRRVPDGDRVVPTENRHAIDRGVVGKRSGNAREVIAVNAGAQFVEKACKYFRVAIEQEDVTARSLLNAAVGGGNESAILLVRQKHDVAVTGGGLLEIGSKIRVRARVVYENEAPVAGGVLTHAGDALLSQGACIVDRHHDVDGNVLARGKPPAPTATLDNWRRLRQKGDLTQLEQASRGQWIETNPEQVLTGLRLVREEGRPSIDEVRAPSAIGCDFKMKAPLLTELAFPVPEDLRMSNGIFRLDSQLDGQMPPGECARRDAQND